MKNRFITLAASGLILACSSLAADPQVKIYLDKESAGWAYKTSDYAFVVEQEGCRIQWNAEEEKDGVRRLLVRQDCKAPFAEQIPLHSAILNEVSQRWPLSSFQSMAWGPLCMGQDMALCKPIIRASLQSKDYRDYCQNYPRSKLKYPNGLFVELANATLSYAPIAGLLREFGANIRLTAVEKVFEARLGKTPFAEEFKALAPRQSLQTRVMFDAGAWYFSLAASGQ